MPVDDGTLALPLWAAVPWTLVTGLGVLAVLAWAIARGRVEEPQERVRWTWIGATAGTAGLLAWWVVAAFHEGGGPLVTHDALRDLMWSVQLHEGGAGPRGGPLIGATPGRLGTLAYRMVAVAMDVGGADALPAWGLGSHVGAIAALAGLATAWNGPRVGLVAAALFLVSRPVVAAFTWFIHGNVLWIAVPLALLSHHAATRDGRTGWVAPMMLMTGVAAQHHLGAASLLGWLLWMSVTRGEDVPWPDAVVALIAAALPFSSGLGVLAEVLWREGWWGVLGHLTAVPLALVWALAVLRPRVLRGRWGGAAGLVVLASVALAVMAVPMRIADLDLVWRGGRSTVSATGWGQVLWDLGVTETRRGTGWSTLWLAMALGVGSAVLGGRWAQVRSAWTFWVSTMAVFVAVGIVAGSELRYAAWATMPMAVLGAQGLVTWWDGAATRASHGWWGRGVLGLAGLAAMLWLPWRQDGVAWLLLAPLAVVWGWPRAVGVVGVVAALGWGVVAGSERWDLPPFPGTVSTDRTEWEGLRGLPGVGGADVHGCVSGLRDPWLLLSESALVFEALDGGGAEGGCGGRWVGGRRTPGENTHAAIAVGPSDLVVVPEFSGILKQTLRVDAWRGTPGGTVPWTLDGLPVRAPMAGLLPPGLSARLGLVGDTLAPGPDGAPTVRASMVVDPTGLSPHSLVVRTLENQAGGEAGACHVVATSGLRVLTPASRDLEPGPSTHTFHLPDDTLGQPVSVDVWGCGLRSFDVFPMSAVRTSDPNAAAPPPGARWMP